jgi:putative DNA primase/helicase
MIASHAEIAELARSRFGTPNARLSRGHDLRFGRKGSTSVDLATGRWFDHEHGTGGMLRPARARPTPHDLWDAARPLARGSPAWLYWVERRCCAITPGMEIRAHAALWHEGRTVPGLVAAVRDARGALVAVHRTFLTRDGRKRDRRFWGKVGGGHVVVHDPGIHAGPGHLLIGEGLESTASAAAERPECLAWSALSASGVPGIALPPGVSHLTIAPDIDAAGTGQRAAAVLAARARARGIAVAIVAPDPPHVDFNDQHCASRREE